MKQSILMPNYDHCILNLITSILKNYKVDSKYRSLEKIDKLLEKQYRKVLMAMYQR